MCHSYSSCYSPRYSPCCSPSPPRCLLQEAGSGLVLNASQLSELLAVKENVGLGMQAVQLARKMLRRCVEVRAGC